MQELDYQKVGERIRQVRKARGWPQQKLAKKCGISLNFMGKIERGNRKMSMDTFANLCMELEVNADALLWGMVQPDEAYNLAAQSHVQVSFDTPEYSGDMDALGVLRILEAIRILGLEKKTGFYQASTSELYGIL